MRQWITASRNNPCPICHKPDWCSQSADGRSTICRRQGGPGAVERRDKNGSPYWVYLQDDSCTRQTQPLPPAPQPERADVADLNRVYRALLRLLALEAEHRQNLNQRGLDDGEIQRRGYRTLPLSGRTRVVQQLVDEFGPDLIGKVPGFVFKRGPHGSYWAMSAAVGLLIPTRTLDGKIAALAMRLDGSTTDRKYRWISSKTRYYSGPSPQMRCHVPLHASDRRTVRVTEGQLKADISTALSGILTLGLPGCGQWQLVLPVLEHLQPETVLLAWDADWRHNPNVAQSLGDCARHLQLMYRVQMESWDPSDGKGIDDVWLAGHQPKRKPWQSAIAAKHRGTARRREGVRHG